MQDSWVSVIALVGFTVAITYAIFPRRFNNEKLKAWRVQEERELASLSISVSDDRYSVNGATATTVQRKEECRSMDTGHVVTFTATRYLRNPRGEYFLWIWRSCERPYVKHMSQTNARIVLKRKYVYPESDA
jgi:hypothetical protein